MKRLKLRGKSAGKLEAIVDDWFISPAEYLLRCERGYHYAYRYIKKKPKLLALDVMEQAGISVPDFKMSVIIYKNDNSLDCRAENLDVVSRSTASHRSRPNVSKSGYRGVYDGYDGIYWVARIHKNGKRRSKLFPHTDQGKLQAAALYDKWAVELFGDVAALNFPPNKT